MPQTFQVWRCYKCSVFQVHQTKKSSKWQCKLCGEKQSIKRYFGIGTAKECRLHVQKLNSLRGEKDEISKSMSVDTDDENDDDTTVEAENISTNERNKKNCCEKESKWSEYIEKSDEEAKENEQDNSHLDNVEVVLELPKRKRKFKCVRATTDMSKFPVNGGQDNVTLGNNTRISSESCINNGKYSATQNIYPTNDIERKNNDNFDKTETSFNVSKVKKEFKVPLIKDNSKWAQFVEDSEVIDEEDTSNSVSNLKDFLDKDYFDNTKYQEVIDATFNKQNSFDNNSSQYKDDGEYPKTEKTSTLFELCDDEELDSVLDI